MAWPDFQVAEPTLSDRGLEVEVTNTSIFPGPSSYDGLPVVSVRVHRGGHEIGWSEVRPYHLACWKDPPRDVCYTRGLEVKEDERGKGIGRYMMERTHFEMHRRGFRHAILDTNPANSVAIQLYENLGFRTIYRVAHMVRETDRAPA